MVPVAVPRAKGPGGTKLVLGDEALVGQALPPSLLFPALQYSSSSPAKRKITTPDIELTDDESINNTPTPSPSIANDGFEYT